MKADARASDGAPCGAAAQGLAALLAVALPGGAADLGGYVELGDGTALHPDVVKRVLGHKQTSGDPMCRPSMLQRERSNHTCLSYRVVELIGTIAAYNVVSRFVVATGVDLE